MSISLNFDDINKVFVVPKLLIDKYINKLNEKQLKILLVLLCYKDEKPSIEDIKEALIMDSVEIEKELSVLKELKLLNIDDLGKSLKKTDLKEKNSEQLLFNDVVDKPYKKGRVAPKVFIEERLRTSEELKFLIKEVEHVLNRVLSDKEKSLVISFYDFYALPADVIIMIFQYSVSLDNAGMKNIEKMVKLWSKEGISTVEQAEKKIVDLEKIKFAWELTKKVISDEERFPNAKEKESASRWVNDWKFDEEIIKEAYDICIKNKGKYILNYVDAVLKNWYNKGIKSIKDLKDRKPARFNDVSRDKEAKVSYNLDEYFKSMDTFT